MKQVMLSNIPTYTFNIFEKYPEITAFCSTRIGGVSEGDFKSLNLGLHVGDDKRKVLENRRILAKNLSFQLKDLTFGQQSHSDNTETVTDLNKGKGSGSWDDGLPETDALITNQVSTPIAVLTADCAPIFLYDPINKAIGIVHSGRIGTEKEIVIKTIQKMHDTFGTRPEKLVAAIGPCVHSCCYETNLPSTIKNQLISLGVSENNIEISDLCTSCNSDVFYSYRASNGKTGRFINLVSLKKRP